MVNMKSKNNARTGGAVSSPKVDFINTGHASQSRYIAALTNPFAAPAVPIPDSFLTAHCAKAGFESTLSGVYILELSFRKTADDVTGNYAAQFKAYNLSGGVVLDKSYTSSVGTRLVAGGISFEDGAQASDVGGFVTYEQQDSAWDGNSFETVGSDTRTERNYGFGSLTYNLNRRQAMDFEGNAHTNLRITFSDAKDIIVRYAAILECDGIQGLTENVVSQSDFIITQTLQNHHAGVFGDTPHPQTNTHLPPSLTDLAPHTTHHFSDMWHTAASWVSAAAGWTWKHRPQIQAWASKAPQIYRDVSAFRGSITAARTGEIMSLGARAAPLLLA